MKFKQIVALLKRNNNAANWSQLIFEDGSSCSYCINDVNLRINSAVVWQKEKPLLAYTFYYLATPVIRFTLPIGSQSQRSAPLVALRECMKRI